MELTQLYYLIERTLCQHGFKLVSTLRNSASYSYFILKDELEYKPISEVVSYAAYSGMCIEVRKCDRRNGSKADVSYYVAIEDVDRSSFRDYKKIKLQRYQTEQTLTNKVIKLANEYKQILTDRQIEKTIDKLLG